MPQSHTRSCFINAAVRFVRAVALGPAAAMFCGGMAAGCAPAASASGTQTPVRADIPNPAPPPSTNPPAAPSSATDPCATRLHELCGPLLFYYALNHRLPARLEELQGLAGPDPAVSYDCPVSDKQYVYVPGGFTRGDEPGFVILHDAEPSHGSFRWAVVVEELKGPKQPLIARVVAVPERLFIGRAADDGDASSDSEAESVLEQPEEPEAAPSDVIPE